MEHFDVGVVGRGYVGLATGACLAYVGHRVARQDSNQERVAGLREGRVPFYEPGLEELIAKSAGRLRFASSESLTEAVRGSDGSRFLSAELGWGGACLPKDVAALRATAREYEHETPLLDAAATVNERQRRRVIHKLQRDLHSLKGRRVTLLGLSFKPNTDELRGAPSLTIVGALNSLGAKVVGYDPVAGKAAAQLTPYIQAVFDPYEALIAAHAAVVVTEWEEVRGLNPKKASSLMREPKLIVDGRNALDVAALQEAGLLYRGFGRGYDRG